MLASLLGCAGSPAVRSEAQGGALVVAAPDDRPVHDCLLSGSSERCVAQQEAPPPAVLSVDQLAQDAIVRVRGASWPELEVNKAFPNAEELVERLKEVGAPYAESQWFGPETPPVWVISLGAEIDVRVMQAIIAACALSGADFGVEFLGERVDGSIDHSNRAYVGSLDAESEDPVLTPVVLRTMLQPGASTAQLIRQGFIDEEAPP